MSDSLWLRGLPGSSVHGILLLQGIFSTQGLNLGLLYCRQILYWLSHQGSPNWNTKRLRRGPESQSKTITTPKGSGDTRTPSESIWAPATVVTSQALLQHWLFSSLVYKWSFHTWPSCLQGCPEDTVSLCCLSAETTGASILECRVYYSHSGWGWRNRQLPRQQCL